MLPKHLFPLLLVSPFSLTRAQQVADTAFYHAAQDHARAAYTAAVGSSARLYNGAAYSGLYPGAAGSPFFEATDTATLFYGGVLYAPVTLYYDLVTQEVVLRTPQQASIRLVPEKIGYFTLGARRFVRIAADSLRPPAGHGFYEVLDSGSPGLVAARSKQLKRGFRTEDPFIFVRYDHYFLVKDGAFLPVKDQRALLAAFPEDAIKKHLNKKGLRFKDNPEQTLLEAIAYYRQLKP